MFTWSYFNNQLYEFVDLLDKTHLTHKFIV